MREYVMPRMICEEFTTDRSFATLCDGTETVTGNFDCLCGSNKDASTIFSDATVCKNVAGTVEGITKAYKPATRRSFSAPGASGLVYICLHSNRGTTINGDSVDVASASQWEVIGDTLTHIDQGDKQGQGDHGVGVTGGGRRSWWHCQVTSYTGKAIEIGIS